MEKENLIDIENLHDLIYFNSEVVKSHKNSTLT